MVDAWRKPSLSIELSSNALAAIEALKFSEPTPVQKTVIPLLLSNKDVAAEAVTGSGKTLAFLLPAFELLSKRNRPWKSHEVGCLIISPTYELALQIFDVMKHFETFYVDSFGKALFTSLVFTGGDISGSSMTRSENLDAFMEQGATLLVATPGRLVDLLQQKHGGVGNPLVRALSSLEVLILDEADRLLEMGFEKQINQILSILPKQRRTGLFSATQTTELEDLLRAGLRNPVRVVVKEQVDAIFAQRTPVALKNYYTVLQPDEKLSTLVNFLLAHPSERLLVFMATCACVDYFARIIRSLLPKSQTKHLYALHGKLRKKRATIFNTFRGDDVATLICTDVMARGIDVPGVSWVLQYDPPTSANAFVHRCGRTARCGSEGRALLLLTPSELAYVDFLQINQKVSVSELQPDDLSQLLCSSAVVGGMRTADSVIAQVRRICLKDKLLIERSVKAFVSYVQFYRKHECHLLLSLKNLDFGRLANGFGLLRLPHMPELRVANTTAFTAPNVDLARVKYRQKSVARQRELQQQQYKEAEDGNETGQHRFTNRKSHRNQPWSRKKDLLRKKEATRKLKASKLRQGGVDSTSNIALKRPTFDDKDVMELNMEYQRLKKARKHEIQEEDLESD